MLVLGSGEARLQEWGYVALSRARAETRLYVTGTPREHESHFHDLDDRDPLARFGRALEESAIEELAVDQHPLPSGPRHDARPEIERSDLTPDERMRRRLLEQKQRALPKTIETAERKLEQAERDLTQVRPSPPPSAERANQGDGAPTPSDRDDSAAARRYRYSDRRIMAHEDRHEPRSCSRRTPCPDAIREETTSNREIAVSPAGWSIDCFLHPVPTGLGRWNLR